ncbi:hypothetical protein BV378_08545 [Nostoc sp. RF31YmG]|nr:hypothetical protein BV378_08545 [Nostoc sp. RF31YmG]
MPNRTEILKLKFTQSIGLPFQKLLPESQIEQAIKELSIKYRHRLFDPFVTLWAFLSQVLDVDKSCHNTVSRVIAWLATENVEIPSTDTSAYCQARKRLPEQLLQKLFEESGESLEIMVTPEHLWCGRHVQVIDCSTVSMPDTLEISYLINISGFRTQSVSLITTLLDTDAFPTHALTQLYRDRWDVELDLKHLKTTLGMDMLRSKTPAMIRKEIYAFLLAYNLLRSLMWDAGTTYGTPPLRLSLQGTRHHLRHFLPQLKSVPSPQRDCVYSTLLKVIVHKAVPKRPQRVEPRVKKRRPKTYPYMSVPRSFLRKKLMVA